MYWLRDLRELMPGVFEIQEDGKAGVIKSNDKCDYETAVDSCPVEAIKIIR